MVGKLDGKVAIVTGSGRGIGRGIALLFAQQGAKVVVADNGSARAGSGADQRVADRVVEEVHERGGAAVAHYGDVADWADAESLIAKALDTWGKLDILVNAAGNYRLNTITQVTEQEWDNIIRVHLRGTFATAHFASIHWRQRREYGRLINFTSGAGIQGSPTMLPYSSAKAGVIGFTRSCANALARYNVTANCIAPLAATRMYDLGIAAAADIRSQTGKWPSETAEGTPLDPVHVAPLVTYLASPAAGNVSGRIFGGRGGRYTLYSEPQEIKELWSPGPWDLDRLFAEFPQTLGLRLKLEDLPTPLEGPDLPLRQT